MIHFKASHRGVNYQKDLKMIQQISSKKQNVKKSISPKRVETREALTFDTFTAYNASFVDAFMNYSNELRTVYKRRDESEHISMMKESWIVNLKSILAPTWADVDLDFHPSLRKKSDIESFFYLRSSDTPVFDAFKESVNVSEEYFTALFSNTYESNFSSLDSNDVRREYQNRVIYYLELWKNFFKRSSFDDPSLRHKLYHMGALLSSLHIKKDILEKCALSYTIISWNRSFELFYKMKYREAYAYAHVSNLDEYMRCVMIPMVGMVHAYSKLSYDDELFEFNDFDTWICAKSIPREEWKGACEKEYQEYMITLQKKMARQKEEQERQARIQALEDAKLDEMIRRQSPRSAQVQNHRFIELLKAEEKPIVYKDESDIPKILRRRETNPSKEGETLLIFHHGSDERMVYTKRILKTKMNDEMICYSVHKLVCELPNLLRNPRNKANFMRSKNIFFTRKVKDMGIFYANQLYETLISFCEEVASTPLEDNELRLQIVQNYYGKKRDTESVENYLFNFRFDVFNSIAMYYCYYTQEPAEFI